MNKKIMLQSQLFGDKRGWMTEIQTVSLITRMFLQHFSASLLSFVTYCWKSWTNPLIVLKGVYTQFKKMYTYAFYQIFAPSCEPCISLGSVAVYLSYLHSLGFPGMLTGAVCPVRSSGLVKSSWYLDHFWPNSQLITCLDFPWYGRNWLHGMLNVTRRIIACKRRRSGLGCLALGRELEPGESEQDPNEGEK